MQGATIPNDGWQLDEFGFFGEDRQETTEASRDLVAAVLDGAVHGNQVFVLRIDHGEQEMGPEEIASHVRDALREVLN